MIRCLSMDKDITLIYDSVIIIWAGACLVIRISLWYESVIENMIRCLSMKEVASSSLASSSSGITRKPCWSAWMSWPGLTLTPNTDIGTSHSTGATWGGAWWIEKTLLWTSQNATKTYSKGMADSDPSAHGMESNILHLLQISHSSISDTPNCPCCLVVGRIHLEKYDISLFLTARKSQVHVWTE